MNLRQAFLPADALKGIPQCSVLPHFTLITARISGVHTLSTGENFYNRNLYVGVVCAG